MSESLDRNISEYQSETYQLNPEALTNQQTVKYLQHIGLYISGVNDTIKETRNSITRDIETAKDSSANGLKLLEERINTRLENIRLEIEKSQNKAFWKISGLFIACLCCMSGIFWKMLTFALQHYK